MADSTYRFKEMQDAAGKIRDIAESYKNAADTLNNDYAESTKKWEGESKEAMAKFMTGPVYEYTHDTVPQLLESLAQLLEANIQQMKSADEQVAENVPTSLG